MKVTLNWIKEFLDMEGSGKSLDASEVAELLTMSGTEVKKVEDIGKRFYNVVTGRILGFDRHPDADKLSVCKVDIGGNTLNIVCGANNFKSGDNVAVATEGAVTAQGMKIHRSKLRGVVSEGMMCSEYELGLAGDSEGIMILGDCTPGLAFAKYTGLDDIVFELEITPNRPDCLSIIGIAREISALTGISFKPPEYDLSGEINRDKSLEIDIRDYRLCPRYSAKIFSDIPAAKSPEWLKNRLALCDYRPVSLIVDLTNYVMHETGQPLHAFDLDLLYSRKIIVRNAAGDETIRSIDDSLRNLKEDMLVIADEKKPVAIAGVMGGKDTEINEDTVNMLLESANFYGPSIMKTSANLGLRSEASNRFEKKIDPELTVIAIKKFSRLLSAMTGKEFPPGIYDNYRKEPRTREIILRMEKVAGVLGKEISTAEISGILSSLGIENEIIAVKNAGDIPFCIKTFVPSSRYEDIEREIDLIEEIARIHGFDKFKSNPMVSPLHRGRHTFVQRLIRQVRQAMVNIGFFEVINYSFTGSELLKSFKLEQEEARFAGAVRILNPLNEDFAFLRTTPMPLMVKNISGNINRGIKDISIFEITKVYQHVPGEKLPAETTVLGVMLSGKASNKAWNRNERGCDFYDIKGVFEYLCNTFYKGAETKVAHKELKFFHPEISAELIINGKVTGIIGKIHPAILDNLDIAQDIFYLEIDMDAFISNIASSRTFTRIPAFPSIDIDIAIVVDRLVAHSDIEEEIKHSGTKLLKLVRLFDLYSGRQIEEDKKSMAYSLSFQDETRTLKDTEVSIIVKRILDNLSKKFGARLRD